MIGIETEAATRIAIARETAETRRAQFARHRAQPRPAAPSSTAAARAHRHRIRSASRA
jgi:hypothetical protein